MAANGVTFFIFIDFHTENTCVIFIYFDNKTQHTKQEKKWSKHSANENLQEKTNQENFCFLSLTPHTLVFDFHYFYKKTQKQAKQYKAKLNFIFNDDW